MSACVRSGRVRHTLIRKVARVSSGKNMPGSAWQPVLRRPKNFSTENGHSKFSVPLG